MATYTLIAKSVLTTDSATIDFTSIPSTYDNLVLKIALRDTRSNSYMNNIKITFNGSSSGYSEVNLADNAGDIQANSDYNNVDFDYVYAASDYSYANIFTNYEMFIPNYANTSYNKSLLIDGNSTPQDAFHHQIIWGGIWANTQAINRITFTRSSSFLFLTNSAIYMYGIKNS